VRKPQAVALWLQQASGSDSGDTDTAAAPPAALQPHAVAVDSSARAEVQPHDAHVHSHAHEVVQGDGGGSSATASAVGNAAPVPQSTVRGDGTTNVLLTMFVTMSAAPAGSQKVAHCCLCRLLSVLCVF
jgi:hypothetical protein